MTYERLVAMFVTDEASYQRYRDGMTPILHGYGGDFRYDFRVSEVLRSEADHPINRVFAIQFPDRAAMDAFFADAAYLAVRSEFFEPAVEAFTQISGYERM